MKKYKQFLLEKIYNQDLNYYAFDWDDNILMMDTILHLDKMVDGEWIPTDVSTSDYTDIRKYVNEWTKGESNIWRYRNGSPEQSYIEFRDYGPRGENAFLEDTITSIKGKKFGPSWQRFIRCLVGGNLFLIVTARGHEPETLRNSIEWIIYNKLNDEQRTEMESNLKEFNKLFNINNDKNFNELVDKYLDLCDFVGLTSSFFRRKYKYEGKTITPENDKKLVVKDFVRKISNYGKLINRKINIGFSDDDLVTVEHMYVFMRDELSINFPMTYHVYYTKNELKKIPF